jgi:hypothetical protein
MPLLRFAEYKPDISDYEGSSTKSILNVVPRGDGYGPFRSFAGFAQSLPAPCRGGFYALNSDGTVSIFAATSTKLYRLDNTTFTWVDVSIGGGSYAGLSATAQWQFAQTGALVFATQANVVLQVYTVGVSTAFGNALGSPPQAAYISVLGQFLVLSGLLSQPFRIQWSGVASFNASTSWTSGINQSDFNDFPDGGVVRGVAGGDQSGIIFQDQAIRTMHYVVGSPIIFQITKMTQGLGLYAPYSLVQSSGSIYFYSGKGFHVISPGGQPTPIGQQRVDTTFLTDLDISNLQLFMAVADPRSPRIFFAYKSTSGLTGQFDKLLGYDTLLDRFFPIASNGQFLLGLSQSGITLESLDAISGSIDAMTLSLDAYPTAVQPQLAQFSGNGTLGFFSGPNLEGKIQTAEQGTDFERLDIRGFMPITDASTVKGSILYRDTQQAMAVQGVQVGLSRIGRCDMTRDARYARFQIDIPAASTWTYAAGVIPDVNPGAQQ